MTHLHHRRSSNDAECHRTLVAQPVLRPDASPVARWGAKQRMTDGDTTAADARTPGRPRAHDPHRVRDTDQGRSRGRTPATAQSQPKSGQSPVLRQAIRLHARPLTRCSTACRSAAVNARRSLPLGGTGGGGRWYFRWCRAVTGWPAVRGRCRRQSTRRAGGGRPAPSPDPRSGSGERSRQPGEDWERRNAQLLGAVPVGHVHQPQVAGATVDHGHDRRTAVRPTIGSPSMSPMCARGSPMRLIVCS
jgi:hypothetical protein